MAYISENREGRIGDYNYIYYINPGKKGLMVLIFSEM